MEISVEQLRELEWAASSYPEDRRCPVCFGDQPDKYGGTGHEPDCWLGEKLKGAPVTKGHVPK